MSTVRNSAGNVSLVVAITGDSEIHPDDHQWYAAEIAGIFLELSKSYPFTPFVLLSGLEGADLVAISAAMKLPNEIDLSYIAVLPSRLDAAEAVPEFAKMPPGTLRVIQLPPVPATPQNVAASGDQSDQQHATLGPFLVKYSQILIAILESDNPSKKSLASFAVSLKLGQESVSDASAFRMMNSNGAGPVSILPARKAVGGNPALRRDDRYPDFSSKENFEESYRLLDQFNRDVAMKSAALKTAIDKSRRDLMEGSEAIGLSDAMQWVATVYSRADALAMHFANISLRVWKVVFVLLAGAGVGLADVHVLNGGTPALAGYYLCLIGAFSLIVTEWKTKRRRRHEDYRALAEALRVQFFWMAAGLRDLAAEQYLRKQTGEMVWIRDAMSECGLFDDVLEHSREARSNRESQMRLAQVWVEGQARYFARREHQNIRKKAILTTLAWIAAGVGFVAPMVGFAEPSEGIEKWCHAVAAVAMFWAALAWNYAERRGFAQEARQYARMHQLFYAANEDLKRFQRDGDTLASEETVRQLGLEALQENGDWLSMHRERKLSPEIAAG